MPEIFRGPRLNEEEAADAASACSSSLPQAIAPDWHPQYGARLAVFPRHVTYGGRVSYWPDLVTLLEDDATRRMLYCPSAPSAYSLLLVFHKRAQAWETFKYRDAELVEHSRGDSFEQAMRLATLRAPRADERG